MSNNNYDDIINLPHHTSLNHKRMPMENRAAQFAPFSALTGYKEEVIEATRLTEKRIELSNELKETISNKINFLEKNIKQMQEAIYTYFVYDNKKDGGKYITKKGVLKRIDKNNQKLILTDKTIIPIKEIVNIESDFFKNIF